MGRAEVVVARVRGNVGEITRDLVVQDDIYSEEVIESAAGSAARIRFRDGTELSVGPSSRVTIDRFVYDPDAGTGTMALGFVSGLFEFVSGVLNPASYELRTPGGRLSIRGTRFVVDTRNQLIATAEGTVVVRPEVGEAVTVSAGECLIGVGSGGRRVRRGSACDDALSGRRAMVAALASVPAPAVAPPAVAPPAGPGRPDDDRPDVSGRVRAAEAPDSVARPDPHRDRHRDRMHDRHRDRDRHHDRDRGRDRGRGCH